MVRPPAPSPSDAVEHVCAALRTRGLPVTAQRRALLAEFVGRTDHPTVDRLHADLLRARSELNRATVYRTLETLVELGLARRVAAPGEACRYDPRVERHHHLSCERCGALEDVFDAALDALRLPRPASGFVARDFSVLFSGLCARCAAGSPRQTRTPSSKTGTARRAPGLHPQSLSD